MIAFFIASWRAIGSCLHGVVIRSVALIIAVSLFVDIGGAALRCSCIG